MAFTHLRASLTFGSSASLKPASVIVLRCSAQSLCFDAFEFVFFAVHVIPQIKPAKPATPTKANSTSKQVAIAYIKFAIS